VGVMSLRAYAKHRKCSLAAVQKAIKAERITVDKDGKIDPVKADADWANNTNAAQQRGKHAMDGAPAAPTPKAAAPRRSTPKTVTQDFDDDDEPPTARKGPPTSATAYATARAMRETFNARRAKLEYEKELGKLVDVEDVKATWGRIIIAAKTAVLSIPTKVKVQLPHLPATDVITIAEIVREVLTSLADDKIKVKPEDDEDGD